jgi:16S rRNA (guanine966-N2)-methyltransferase
VRVIAGELGGRRLAAPRGLGTRPTSDRVREAMFMALEPLAGVRVVDLFAGSGALGIEALSRGAAKADFVESDRSARRVLEENLVALQLQERTRVWSLHLPQGLKSLTGPVAEADLILLDPPYGGGPARLTLEALATMTLKARVRVVVEHHMRDVMPERSGGLSRDRERRYGETRVSTYRLIGEAGTPPTKEATP